MHVSYSFSFFISEVANQTPVELILCSQISVQVCWSHLLWGGGSAWRLGQWPDSLLIQDGFCTGPLFWLWWWEENVVCTLFCRAWTGPYPDIMGTDLSSVLYSVPPFTLTATAQNCHVSGQMSPSLHQGRCLPWGLIEFASLCHQPLQRTSLSRNSCHPTVTGTSPMH